ncbi:hypothetical protein K8R62_03370 [bacterium]|nr:hypothetical protein [bacterium]
MTTATVWAEDQNEASAQAIYSPTLNSTNYGAQFVYPGNLPILPEGAGARPILSSETKIFKPEGLEEIPMNILESRSRGWNIFSEPYQASVWFKEQENENNINILPGVPQNTRLLGQVRIIDYGDYAPLEVIKQVLYYAKDLTYTSNVLLLQRKIPVARSNSKGLGASSVNANLHDQYSEALTVAGSGLFSQSAGWVDYGVEITALCYEDLPKGVATLPFCQSTDSELKTVAKRLKESYEPGKKIYFVSYCLQNETREKAMNRAQKTAQKFVGKIDENLLQNFQLITPQYSPTDANIKENKIVDLFVANEGFQINVNPHIRKK